MPSGPWSLLLLIIVAIFAPLIATHDPNATNSALVFAPPGSEYWLGGDQVGRDVFSRLVYGARISLYAGLFSAFIGASIGMMIGVTSVHFGGTTDLIIQRVIDAMMAFPPLILAISIMAALGASLNNVVIALSIAFIPSTARVLRSQALAIKEMNYVLAAKAIGASHTRVIFRYMIPNCLALFIVLVTTYSGHRDCCRGDVEFPGHRSAAGRAVLGRHVERSGTDLRAPGPSARRVSRPRHRHRRVCLEPVGRFPARRAGSQAPGNRVDPHGNAAGGSRSKDPFLH